jgi:hypothetical protein
VKYRAIFAFEINHVTFFCVSLYNTVITFQNNQSGAQSLSASEVRSVEYGAIYWGWALWLRRKFEGKLLAKIHSAPPYPTSWLKLGEYLRDFPDDIEPIMWMVFLSELVLVECSPIKGSWFCSLVSLICSRILVEIRPLVCLQ